MREYAIDAIVLGLEHPERLIAALPEPLLVADESEREGYVPNVVYSCGPMIHGNNIVPSYGRSDSSVPGYRRRPSRWGAAGRCDRERSAAGVASVERGWHRQWLSQPGDWSQGSMTSIPVPSKSDTLRVATAAP